MAHDLKILGLLLGILWAIFYANRSSSVFARKFFQLVPPLFLCYFVPSLLRLTGLYEPEGSSLYWLGSRFFLPLALFFFLCGIRWVAIWSLGPKALIAFFTGTLGIVLGGPLSLWIVGKVVGVELPDEAWRGLATVAGSWIGGGANQLAMKELWQPEANLFAAALTVDIFFAGVWVAVLLFLRQHDQRIDRWTGAKEINLEKFIIDKAAKPHLDFYSLLSLMAAGGVAVSLAHYLAGPMANWITRDYPHLSSYSLTSVLFWLILFITVLAILASLSPLKKLETKGASELGAFFLYLLIAIIGLQLDIRAIKDSPALLLVGSIWLLVHISLLFLSAKLFRIPFFYIAVGSQANIGGAASAPVVAAAFDPKLVPVGVLLAILGYAVGTYGAYVCALLLRLV